MYSLYEYYYDHYDYYEFVKLVCVSRHQNLLIDHHRAMEVHGKIVWSEQEHRDARDKGVTHFMVNPVEELI